MPMNPKQFASIVLEAFVANGKVSDNLIYEAGGPSDTYMTSLRKVAAGEADMRPLRSDTARRIDAAAGWKPGSTIELWHTGELPNRHDSRAAAPSSLASINRVESTSSRDDDGAYHAVVESIATMPGGESRMRIHYWPGAGKAITSIDLVSAVAGAHRAALELTYLEEGGTGRVATDPEKSDGGGAVNELGDRRRKKKLKSDEPDAAGGVAASGPDPVGAEAADKTGKRSQKQKLADQQDKDATDPQD